MPFVGGAAATAVIVGGGVCHDSNDFGTLKFANGFANGAGSSPSFEPFFEPFCSKLGMSRLVGRPAFRSAILVVIFANILDD